MDTVQLNKDIVKDREIRLYTDCEQSHTELNTPTMFPLLT